MVALTALDLFVLVAGLSAVALLRWRQWKADHPDLVVVQQLFLYPIKGLRPISPTQLQLATLGFKHDRRFVLVSPKDDGSYEVHLAADYPSHSLLRQSIEWDAGTLTVTPPLAEDAPLTLPLTPDISGLSAAKIALHSSPTIAYDVGEAAAAFFTKHSDGKATRLFYLEEGASANRKVLGSIALGADERIAFQDCASYMIASSASLDAFSRALGREMSILPLRPNIVVGGPGLRPWVEDFWQELRVAGKTTFRITSNCVRCVSLNTDYETGKRLEGTGLPLQTLAKDRRVDAGSYSPVFGRYGFSKDVGHTISVGDKVAVTRLYKRRTTFSWPGVD